MATDRFTLPLQAGEGRWLNAGRGLRLVMQHGRLACTAAPQWPATCPPPQRLADGDTLLLTGWHWLQAERGCLLLGLPQPGPAALWRRAARELLQAAATAARAAAATLRPAGAGGLPRL